MIEEFSLNVAGYEYKSYKKIGDKFYKVNKELLDKAKIEPDSIGIYLGKINKGKFLPSIEFIDILSKRSRRKLTINDDKTEWLYLCGRDIFGKSISKYTVKNGFAFVFNGRNENLGYGKFIENINKKEKAVFKNLLDKGAYLRIER